MSGMRWSRLMELTAAWTTITLVVDTLAVEHLRSALAIQLGDAVEGPHVSNDPGHDLGDRRLAGHLDDGLVVNDLVDGGGAGSVGARHLLELLDDSPDLINAGFQGNFRITDDMGQHSVNSLRQQIEPFVRDHLGCGCPDEVFRDIRLVDKPAAFALLPVDYALEIGGRLLVVICQPARCVEVSRHLDDLFRQASKARDQGGFNRFRLIVPAIDQGATSQELESRFSALAGEDDRAHLHIVGPIALPNIRGSDA